MPRCAVTRCAGLELGFLWNPPEPKPECLQALNAAVRSGADDVKAAALETMGNLAFARPNRVVLLACEGLREWLARLAEAQVRAGTVRVLLYPDRIWAAWCCSRARACASGSRAWRKRMCALGLLGYLIP